MAATDESFDDYHKARREAVERLNRSHLGPSTGVSSKVKVRRAAVLFCAIAAVLGTIAGLYLGLR